MGVMMPYQPCEPLAAFAKLVELWKGCSQSQSLRDLRRQCYSISYGSATGRMVSNLIGQGHMHNGFSKKTAVYQEGKSIQIDDISAA